MLTAALGDLDAGAGNRYVTLTLTDKSGKHCRTGGWSGLQLTGAAGKIPTTVLREGTARTEAMDARWEYGPVCRHGEIRLTPLGAPPPA